MIRGNKIPKEHYFYKYIHQRGQKLNNNTRHLSARQLWRIATIHETDLGTIACSWAPGQKIACPILVKLNQFVQNIWTND
jgi:hypothetical protein